MSLEGIAISGRGALAQAARIDAIARRVAAASRVEGNGQRVGQANGQQGRWEVQGLGKNGQLVGLGEDAARGARTGDVLQGNRIAPVLESAELIRALRALEANLQAIRIQDAVLERTVNELARPIK
jgi:flagellar basal body rod protein FlgC